MRFEQSSVSRSQRDSTGAYPSIRMDKRNKHVRLCDALANSNFAPGAAPIE